MPYKHKEDRALQMRRHRLAERRLLRIAKIKLTPQWKWICKDLGIKPATPEKPKKKE